VIVSPQAIVHGVTTADNIKVQGVLNDVVVCKNLLVIAATGLINGNVAYGMLDVAKGGKILGDISLIG